MHPRVTKPLAEEIVASQHQTYLDWPHWSEDVDQDNCFLVGVSTKTQHATRVKNSLILKYIHDKAELH
jgi:hypothetical protein